MHQKFLFTLLFVGAINGCENNPTERTANILGKVLCSSSEVNIPLENTAVQIGGKQTLTANDGSFLLNGVNVGSVQLVTISGPNLTKAFKTNQNIVNNLEIAIPEQFCSPETINSTTDFSNDQAINDYQVIFTEPRDNGTVFATGGGVTRISCKGKVLGPKPYQGLLVELAIQTDQLYPQGTAIVRSDGSWEVTPCHFGGNVHLLQAELKREGSVLVRKEISVRRVHR